MEELADKAILDTVKVSHEHVIFTPLLAPQTPPKNIITGIDQIYKKGINRIEKGGQEATGLTEEFFFGTGRQTRRQGQTRKVLKYPTNTKISLLR